MCAVKISNQLEAVLHVQVIVNLRYKGAALAAPARLLELSAMILILLAIHLLSQDGKAAPLSHSLDARATTNSCKDIDNCRTFFSIVWGCLATIFACTWVSVHPNVPPPNQNRLQLFWRRLKMMLIGIIAPEIMVGFATRQRLAAHALSKKFEFSITHGMFVSMGGFVTSDGHPIATWEQLKDSTLGPEFQAAIQKVSEEEITDKSKGDTLSKGVALLQGLWFILQTLARAHQHLAITQLEATTLAFAVVNIFIWLLWWNKPLDVQWPIVVGPPKQPDAETITLPVQLSRLERFWGLIGGYPGNIYKPLSSVSVPSFWAVNKGGSDEADFLLTLVGTLFGAVHCAAWNAVFPTPAEMRIWRTSSVVITAIPGLGMPFSLLDTSKRRDLVLTVISVIVSTIVVLGSPIYIAARIILIVLPLVELRSLPASAFVDVNWSTYIPHI
ncbi:hypothetical protein MSAN_00623300 [Mycena sanguinolenta]|uniref:Uncharacterized protein n=1 Tax=Mycena sanguinolenta TaxID=230812 RepID=A0A8H6Z3D2_9AGAR|nr:hypothetical protein MSAN_00623300 [Mycena sanguinolenta]